MGAGPLPGTWTNATELSRCGRVVASWFWERGLELLADAVPLGIIAERVGVEGKYEKSCKVVQKGKFSVLGAV